MIVIEESIRRLCYASGEIFSSSRKPHNCGEYYMYSCSSRHFVPRPEIFALRDRRLKIGFPQATTNRFRLQDNILSTSLKYNEEILQFGFCTITEIRENDRHRLTVGKYNTIK